MHKHESDHAQLNQKYFTDIFWEKWGKSRHWAKGCGGLNAVLSISAKISVEFELEALQLQWKAEYDQVVKRFLDGTEALEKRDEGKVQEMINNYFSTDAIAKLPIVK